MMEILKENFGLLILVLLFVFVVVEHRMGKNAKQNPKMAGSILEALLTALGSAGRKPKE